MLGDMVEIVDILGEIHAWDTSRSLTQKRFTALILTKNVQRTKKRVMIKQFLNFQAKLCYPIINKLTYGNYSQ